jgi:predicted dithiol-disulfide oxidoreductase (DUF899 family)
MTTHEVVSKGEWVEARKRLLAKEKEFTRMRDQLRAERRALPWMRIDKDYTFDGPNGRETLAQLFGDRSQLVVYHFMFAPEWDVGCKSCSFWADNFNGITAHLRQRDVAFAAISRAPLAKLQAFAQRLGWTFKWVSSQGTDFNYDFEVSFQPDALAPRRRHLQLRQAVLVQERGFRPQHRPFGHARHQRVREGRERRDLSHVLDLRPRARHDEHGVPLPRSRPQGPRRGRAADGMGEAARSL